LPAALSGAFSVAEQFGHMTVMGTGVLLLWRAAPGAARGEE
jgi:hypothetical protein